MNLQNEFIEQAACKICPRQCNADRINGNLGFCNSDTSFNISSIFIHHGEEPVISGSKGICNIFFSRCNLQCKYCQNFQISRNKNRIVEKPFALNEIIEKIADYYYNYDVKSVGFVSPSHFIPQMKLIIDNLRNEGINPIFVFNTNAYDRVETIKSLESYIDVYLPDFKYMINKIAKSYSGAENYSEFAAKAIKEMFRQKGSRVYLDENDDYAVSGLIIRHLILPGNIDNSIKVLEYIANEISTKIHLSLMSQYYPPTGLNLQSPLNRKITEEEYEKVIEAMENFGFENGWVQELESSESYLPDFEKEIPFCL